jgi:threonine dehydrogenase-like Zn-dependent dehydrogenase
MRALLLENRLNLVDDYPDPSPAVDECLVRVKLAGICGTDLELVHGYMNYAGVPGHEFVGVVASSRNQELVGMRVVGEINAACGQCNACIDGLERHCANRTVLGILSRDGAFADYLTLPERNLRTLPDSIPDEGAVFVEPIAAGYEILDQVSLKRNARILVLGDGRLGAIVALVLKAEAYEPIVAGHHPEKLRRLTELGLKVDLEENLLPGYDVVVDCSGNSQGFNRALALVRPRGTVVLKSTAAAAAPLNLAPVVVNEVTVIGSRCGRFEPAIEALASGKIDPCPLIDGTYQIEDYDAAFKAAANPLNFKILLRM